MGDARIETFEEFWPYYVGEHRHPVTRALHYAGTTMVIGTAVASVVTLNPAWLLLAPVVGYTPAWIGHFFVEKNRPATFRYPLFSLAADFKMYGLALRGRMAEEVERVVAAAAARQASTGDEGAQAPSVTNGAHAADA